MVIFQNGPRPENNLKMTHFQSHVRTHDDCVMQYSAEAAGEIWN